MIEDPHIPGNIRCTKAYAQSVQRNPSVAVGEEADVEDTDDSDEQPEVISVNCQADNMNMN